MKRQGWTPAGLERYKLLVVGGIALAIFIVLVSWAGLPPADQVPAFAVGVATLVGSVLGLGLLFWHLLIRPLPAKHVVPTRGGLSVSYRRLLALLVGISGISLVVGAFWDEVWHRTYGIPFGKDLLWRPHLMMYASFMLVSGLAGAGLVYLLKSGQGTLQQRFRANPTIGLLVLFGGFQTYAVPADPIWHLIYGKDISAWSLPHLILVLNFVLIMLLAAAIHLSTAPSRQWTSITRTSPRDALIVLVMSFALLLGLQVLTTEWETFGSGSIIWQRPAWLLPVVIVVVATFVGTATNHAMRSFGASTAVGILALAMRVGLLRVFGIRAMSADAWICALPPMMALDLWYGYRVLTSKRPASWLMHGIAAMIGMGLVGFPLINRFFPYPKIGVANLLPFVVSGLLAALGASWAGVTTGDYLATANKQLEDRSEAQRHFDLASPIALVAVVGFIIVFIVTARPPF